MEISVSDCRSMRIRTSIGRTELSSKSKDWRRLGASFESINYPGYYIHARNDELFIDKYDGSARFRAEATFVIVEPQFKLW
jgi:Alpha-L-arabinofuranosidase B (ABFB) domain